MNRVGIKWCIAFEGVLGTLQHEYMKTQAKKND